MMIKKAISLLAITVLICNVSCKKANDGFPTMNFAKAEHDFGTIKEGDKVATVFEFTNAGDSDLLITKAVGSCGCTVPEYPKTPIKPGESGKMKVSFNSHNKTGKQTKSVIITANTKSGTEKLTIKADITPDPNKKEPTAPFQQIIQKPKK
jgi:hypothetical protein